MESPQKEKKHMNNLIDQHLINLLRISTEQRTQANIAETINQINAAAQLDATPLSLAQQEHSKLAAIVEFLAVELDMKSHDTVLDIRESQVYSLSAMMRVNFDGQYLMGFGQTAEEVLRDLHPVKANKDAA
jgi:ABC-type hemin transport system substrate-binding protein